MFLFTACQPTMLGENQDNLVHSSCFSAGSLGTGSVTIPNGVACYNGNNSGSVATYQCTKGYTLSGNSQWICQRDGNWNGMIPRCEFGE